MNYEKKNDALGHDISLRDRKKLEITGIKKLDSLTSEEFVLSTIMGVLLIRGLDLEMQHLDIDKGVIWLTGTIYLMEYLDTDKTKKPKENFFGKVFK